jgi:plastocyanin
MRTSRALLGLVVVASVACDGSTEPPTAPPDPCANSVTAGTVSATDGFAFTPPTVTITVGQSICWQNTGRLSHTLTDVSTNGRRFNGDLAGGQAFVHTFGFGGTFSYRCRNHSNMTGTIVVNCQPGQLVC